MPPANLSPALLKLLGKYDLLPVERFLAVERISTGTLAVDWATGGGWARGHINKIVGDPSTGKTTLALLAAFEATRRQQYVAYLDVEHGADPQWVGRIGCDPAYLHLYQPDTGEAMLDAVVELVRDNAYDLIVIDSVAAASFSEEQRGGTADAHVGLAARRWSAWQRKIKPALRASKTAILLINQLTYSIGGYSPAGPQANAEYGGRGLRYATNIGLKTNAPNRKDPKLVIFSVKTNKNRTAAWPREASFSLFLGEPQARLLRFDELVATGRETGLLLDRAGQVITGNPIYHYQGEPMLPSSGKGSGNAENAIRWLAEHPDRIPGMEAEIRARFAQAENYATIAAESDETEGEYDRDDAE